MNRKFSDKWSASLPWNQTKSTPSSSSFYLVFLYLLIGAYRTVVVSMAVVYIPTGYTFSLSHFVSLISFLRLLFSYILSRRQHTICPARHKNRNKANEFCYRREKGGDCPPLLDSAQLSAHPGHIPPLPEIRCLSKQEAARVGTCRHHPTQYTAHQYRQLFGVVSTPYRFYLSRLQWLHILLGRFRLRVLVGWPGSDPGFFFRFKEN
jgi:hypothetical protein